MALVAPVWASGYVPSGEEWAAWFTSIAAGVNAAVQYRGGWNSGNSYETNDAVFYTEAFWLCISPTLPGNEPASGNASWKKWSGSGDGTIADGAVTNSKIAPGVNAAKIGDGTVSNTEFGALDGVTGNIQTQLNARPTSSTVADLAASAAAGAFEAGQGITIATNPDTGKKTITAAGDIAATLTRADVVVTTGALANGATDASKSVSLGRSALVYRVASDRAAWVRCYTSAAAQAADAGRAMDAYPVGEHGLVFDVVLRTSNLVWDLAPIASAANMEAVPSQNYHLTVVSLASGNAPVQITITKLTTEL